MGSQHMARGAEGRGRGRDRRGCGRQDFRGRDGGEQGYERCITRRLIRRGRGYVLYAQASARAFLAATGVESGIVSSPRGGRQKERALRLVRMAYPLIPGSTSAFDFAAGGRTEASLCVLRRTGWGT